MLLDCKRAIHWARNSKQAKEYGAGNIVAAAGESAGAHLAMLTALTNGVGEHQPGYEEFDTSIDGVVDLFGPKDMVVGPRAFAKPAELSRPWYLYPTDSLGFTGHYSDAASHATAMALETVVVGAPNVPENRPLYEKISPSCYLEKLDGPPVPWYALIGSLDRLVDPEEAKACYGRFNAETRPPHVFHVLEGAQHGFVMFPSIRVSAACDGAIALLDHLVKTHEASRRGEGDIGKALPGELDSPLLAGPSEGSRVCCNQLQE